MKFYKQYKNKNLAIKLLGRQHSEPIVITESEVREELDSYYQDLDLAIQTLKDGQKLQSYFAFYSAK